MEKDEEYIIYKVNTKYTYKVYVQEHGTKKYYKALVKQKNYDKTETVFYKQLTFVKCTPPENGEIIRIKRGIENLYPNPKDPYNPISVITVLDYEKKEDKKISDEQAYQKYQDTLKENEEVELDESNLPF